MSWFIFIVNILAVWRITHLIQAEDGPFDLIFRLRKIAGKSLLGALMDCFYCLSMWVALPSALYYGNTWIEKILLTLAFSAGAIFLNRVLHKENN